MTAGDPPDRYKIGLRDGIEAALRATLGPSLVSPEELRYFRDLKLDAQILISTWLTAGEDDAIKDAHLACMMRVFAKRYGEASRW